MSLAADLLKRAERMPARVSKQNLETKPAKKVKRKQIKRRHKKPKVKHIKGITFVKRTGGWCAFIVIDGAGRGIGVFKDRKRALMALRLYQLWQARGFEDIPLKPTKRTYNHW